MPQNPATASQSGQAAPKVQPAPFRAGVQRTLSTDGYTNSTVATTTATELPLYEASPNAFLRGLWILSSTVSTQAAGTATATVSADWPFNTYSSITFQDSNQKPIFGPFDGYTAMIVGKYGGYQYNSDPRNSAVYQVTPGQNVGTNSGTLTGTFGQNTFVLYVPIEVVSRDALGVLENKSTAQPFSLDMTINTPANMFAGTQAAMGTQTVTTKIIEDGWWQPKAATAGGVPLAQTPPNPGTTQYWTRGSYPGLSGAQQIQVSQGLGYPIRNWIALNYQSQTTTQRSNALFPDPFQIIYKGVSIFNVPQKVWQDQMSRQYGFNAIPATVGLEAANGLEIGVYALNFNVDFSQLEGDELRNGYLNSQQGDLFQTVATWNSGTTSTMYALVNYVAPGNGNADSLRAGR